MTVIAFIIGILLMVVGLAVSIALHELGHLAPAKLFGVRVGQYMIGFGPTLWSRRRGETEYGIKAIPLGGYISMAGMYPPSPKGSGDGRAGGGFFATMVQDARASNDETIAGDEDRVFYKLPVYQRIIIMLGGPVMNLLLAIVLFAIVFSGFGVATATTTVSSVSQCVIPASENRTTCRASDPEAPAAAAGLKPGDTIVSIDGTAVSSFDQASAIIQRSPNTQLTFVVERDGQPVTLQVTPMLAQRAVTNAQGVAEHNADGTVKTENVGFVGIGPTSEMQRQPILAGPQAALQNVAQVGGLIWQMPVKVYETAVTVVTGGERSADSPMSIVGAGVLAGEVASADVPVSNRIAGFLSLLASLNIALFVFNLVPLLPLDGGHVAVALWDGVKRAWARLFRRPPPKPVDATRLVPVTFVVVVALIVMGGVLILADLVNPVSLLGH
ncbi:zinc metalloprotease [Microbacterium mangrovi]|uniref:Zinc metalloprotease n=1 Tax=Microbacterium mangrovi TaxID=1348253 RepID=A0A0B2A561_9MICO|nr:site-2 protease family protein [Microbacterium mangrovi]KHK98649.1 zinc metalloprotease [Microbacterium mangrovi]